MWKNMVQPDTPQKTMIHSMEHMQFAYRITKATKQTHTHNIQKLSFFHGNNGYTNAPQCYIMCTLSVLLDKRYVTTLWLVQDTSQWKFCTGIPPYCAFHLALFSYSKFLSLFFYAVQKCYTGWVSFWALVFMFTPPPCFKWQPRAAGRVQWWDEMLLKAEHFSWP